MSSLKADFNELRERIRHGREFGHASFEPIYYLVFSPESDPRGEAPDAGLDRQAAQEGWDVRTFSIAEQVCDILSKATRLRKLWVVATAKRPLDWRQHQQVAGQRPPAKMAPLQRGWKHA